MRKLTKTIFKKIGEHLNKVMPVKYYVMLFFLILPIILFIMLGITQIRSVFVYSDENNYTGLSNWCYEKKNYGKVCLTETKVMWFEKTREEIK